MEREKMIIGIQHIGIPTDDIDKTIAFYTEIGFKVSLRTRNKQANEEVAFLRLGNLTIETYENYAANQLTGAIDHIALDVSDIETVFQFVKEKGFSSLEGQICFLPFWENGVRFFTIKGPNGEKIEFNQML